MSDPTDYTVGWICALFPEYLAAQLQLDEEHEGPRYVTTGDQNDYTLGKIGRHNVVIAVLPAGTYGLSSATGVVKDMLHSFPNVRTALMVGIGGGVPLKHDVRLGDVVVSVPGNGHGGIFQYDFGSAMQGQEFQESGFQNQPPPILRAAVNGLKTQYARKGHQIDASIKASLEENPRLKKVFAKPDSTTDRLYHSHKVHHSKESKCAAACGDGPEALRIREERAEDDDNPAIHYGLIASANRLMKDALVRDKLAGEKDILCFEMEAAGLMNHFPVLVVRGICDYSDSHKNDEWQGYAAMTAAVYAKDLLCRIAPTQIEGERRLQEVLVDLQSDIAAISSKADTIIDHEHQKRRDGILRWLTDIEYGHRQSYNFGKAVSGTGQWFLDSPEYQEWLASNGKTLFCPGIPGAGKTILTSIIIDDIEKRIAREPHSNIGLAYVYFEFQREGEQGPDEVFAALLKQLSQSRPCLPEGLESLHLKCKGGERRPLLKQILSTLKQVIDTFSQVYLLIDALDECQTQDYCRSQFLAGISYLHDNSAINLLVTSRPIMMETTNLLDDALCRSIRATENDIDLYLEQYVKILRNTVTDSPGLRLKIRKGILHAADGMFLLAQIYLDFFNEQMTENEVLHALKRIRKEATSGDKEKLLLSAYHKAIERIKNQSSRRRQLAMEVLLWVTYAKRRLGIDELRHALATRKGTRKLETKDLIPIEDVVSTCAGLVTVDRESNLVHLAHYTAREYLNGMRHELFIDLASQILTTCVAYMMFDTFNTGGCTTNSGYNERIKLHPFLQYAACHWGHHAREVSFIADEVWAFSASSEQTEASGQVLWKDWGCAASDAPKNVTGLHLAASFGIVRMMHQLITTGTDVNVRDIKQGQTVAVDALLNVEGIDIDAKNHRGKTPLARAAKLGNLAISKLLVNKGNASLTVTDFLGVTPVGQAIIGRSPSVFKMFIDTGMVDIGSQEVASARLSPLLMAVSYDWTPLCVAVSKGYESITRMLLDSGRPDIHVKDRKGRTLLSLAAKAGNQAVMKMLLQTTRLDINAQDKKGQTPLLLAAKKSNESVVRVLLDTGKVNVNTQDSRQTTPLLWAYLHGNHMHSVLMRETDGAERHSQKSSG
ncbi:hypothetical protein B0I35DRAFT_452792 [Stachybotrys elegans]|uniref:Nucleoside phosphorylase domain-containing protein n=1 Tax=Stachybotrys elegans TaxID=80388 RepID=A0A8K0WN80_9HYPO|nr:hypothetical protein B0I35DRAFT_452792 [Stachybotrys elegans]